MERLSFPMPVRPPARPCAHNFCHNRNETMEWWCENGIERMHTSVATTYNGRTRIQREHSYSARSDSRISFRISNQSHTYSNSTEIFCIFVFTIIYIEYRAVSPPHTHRHTAHRQTHTVQCPDSDTFICDFVAMLPITLLRQQHFVFPQHGFAKVRRIPLFQQRETEKRKYETRVDFLFTPTPICSLVIFDLS